MQLSFILDLCEKIHLPPEAQETALRAFSQYEKPLLRAVKHSDFKNQRACMRRLRCNREKGAAFCLAFCLLQAENAYKEYRARGIPDAV